MGELEMDNGTSMEIDGIIFDGIYLWIIMGHWEMEKWDISGE